MADFWLNMWYMFWGRVTAKLEATAGERNHPGVDR